MKETIAATETVEHSVAKGCEGEHEQRLRLMIRIMVADDHPIVREGIRKLLDLEEDLEVVAEATDGREVLETVSEHTKPDIILLDLKMPGMDGLAVLQTLQHLKSDSKSYCFNGVGRQERVGSGDETGLRRNSGEADPPGTDCQEYP